MTVACHYAIIRFLPFVETGEFANVGVVLFSPSARYFGFQLMKGGRHARITNFFEQLDGKVFRRVMRQAREELERVASEFKPLGTDRRLRSLNKDAAFALWTELTKPLASVLRMSDGRLVMAEDPQTKLNELFEFYVERNFVTREYQEEIMVRSVRGVLRGLGIADRYQHMRVGNDEYNAAFPFVATAHDERPVQIIKPLNLAYEEPTRILDHGAAWIHRVGTLRRKSLLPESVLIAVSGNDDGDTRQAQARRDVIREFRDLDVEVQSVTDREAVRLFASQITRFLPDVRVELPQAPLGLDVDVYVSSQPRLHRPKG